MLLTLVGVVSVVAVILVGLIAGLLVGTAIEQKTLEVLDGPAWIKARHSTDAVFRRVLPWWWNSTLLMLFLAAYLNRGGARGMFLVGGLLLLAGIVVTLAIEVPMNKQVAGWEAGAMPAGWMAVRDRWWRFHVVRSVLGAMGFACAVCGLAWR